MEWISIKDRLPKPYEDVLVSVNGKYVCEGYRDSVFWCIPGHKGVCDNDITHWTQMPEPPKACD